MNDLQKLSLMMAVLVRLRVGCFSTDVKKVCERAHFQCDDGECIAITKMCDGKNDCKDQSDEVRCNDENYPKCPKGYLQCVSNRHCFVYGWHCDGDEDCPDGSDELNCASVCKEFEEFECLKNKQCIPARKRCDTNRDCADGSDELNCEGHTLYCSNAEFPCKDEHCIPRDWLCDGEIDCNGGSDEMHCGDKHHAKCHKSLFTCASGMICISNAWRCDGDKDCPDGSDELDCDPQPCEKFREFQCLKNEQCIPAQKRCDGKIDCDDGSDELNCNAYPGVCLNTEFSCKGRNRCVRRDWLCDGENDCNDGSDEKHCGNDSSISSVPSTITPKTTELSCPDNYCMHSADCVVLRGQYYCNCPPSYTGEKCERNISAARKLNRLGIIVGISVTSTILLIIIVSMLVCYFKRRSASHSKALMSKDDSRTIVSYSKE